MTYSFAHGNIKKAVPQKYVVITEAMKTSQRCARCMQPFKECENIGSWDCVMHALPLDSLTGLFSCCGTSLRGCIPCDHIADLSQPYPNSQIPPGTRFGVYAFRVEQKYADQLPNLIYGDKRIVTVDEDKGAFYILRRRVNQ